MVCRVQGTGLGHRFIQKIQANAGAGREARHADAVSIKREEIQYSLEVVVFICFLNKASNYRITASFLSPSSHPVS